MTKRPPIVFIHGMWGTPSVWHNFRDFFLQQGYEVHTPALRHHHTAQNLNDVGRLSIRDYVEDLSSFIESLPDKPLLIGHSMGGLLALLLAGKGLGRGAVLLAPAAPAGLLAIRYSVLKTFAAILMKRGFWRTAHKPSPKAAAYGLFNRQPDEVQVAHYQDMVFESGRAACEIAFWWLDPHKSTRVESTPDIPMLVVAGKEDRLTSVSTCYKTADRYGASFHLFNDHAHELHSEPGWERIAEQIAIWIDREVN
ncbi:alpha/beta hydrolase [Sansalvadorimonas verongulae]|uniref:alpha/beta hydrolase n=1 Tax=Sansalvadorimonas verongulae TaxID=2172824 RepID=UPI0012BC5A45|nr:alpha/beta hydrolase [Sansalvadorimonas verongulae]MTI14625.1 alpha/beta hydrolase [Sansalvadorimonas verongulae]